MGIDALARRSASAALREADTMEGLSKLAWKQLHAR
jgi:hypothetical protein